MWTILNLFLTVILTSGFDGAVSRAWAAACAAALAWELCVAQWALALAHAAWSSVGGRVALTNAVASWCLSRVDLFPPLG